MNKTTPKSLQVHPQTTEIPEPLTIHPSVSPLAAELLMKTARELMVRPWLYDQSKPIARECGAPCCIIGHMMNFSGQGGMACEPQRVGLSSSQFVSIFHAFSWPVHPKGSATTAAEGIARIEHFLRTGE